MLFWIFVAALILAGLGCVAAGLGRARFRLAPVIANVVIVATYGAVVAPVWAWASRCWNCGYELDSREVVYVFTVAPLGIVAIVAMGLTWLAAWVSTLIWRGQTPLNVPAIVLAWAGLMLGAYLLAIAGPP